jgi:heat shock protein HslJ
MQKNVDTINTLAGRWVLMPVMPSDTATGNIPYINFDLQEGRFSGNSGCNNMGGSFFVKQDALQFGENIISTKMDCPGYNEKPFLDNLLKTNRYEIKDGVLQLMYNTTILSKWVRNLDTNPTKQI